MPGISEADKGRRCEQHLRYARMVAAQQGVGNLLAAHLFRRRRLVLAAGGAEWLHRTLQAQWTLGQADGGSQFHHRLVEVSRALGIDQAGSTIAKPFCLGSGRGRLFVLGKDAQQHALDIAIDHRNPLAKGNAGDGRGGVLSYPGQLAQLRGGGGQGALMFLDDDLRGLVHHFGATVVPQPAPRRQHGWFLGQRKSGNGREQGQKAGVVVEDGGHPGLLQHDLGDPDSVGVSGSPPREISRVGIEPGQ